MITFTGGGRFTQTLRFANSKSNSTLNSTIRTQATIQREKDAAIRAKVQAQQAAATAKWSAVIAAGQKHEAALSQEEYMMVREG